MYNKYLDEMKKSNLKEAIKSEIKSILTEAIGDDLDDRIGKAGELKTAIDAAGENLEEALNPEVVSVVNKLIKGMAKKYGYEEKDAVFAIQAALKQRDFDLREEMTDKERENRIQHLMRTGAKEKPLRKLAAMGKEDDMHDDPGDIRIDHDYYTENLKEEEEPTAADVKKEKSITKEKADALKTKEAIDKIKKDLKKNKSELLKISKIDRKERTKAEQSLFDSMIDKTKELKKLEKSL